MNLFKSLFLLTASILFVGCGQTPNTNTAANNNPTNSNAATQTPAASPPDLMAQGRKLYVDNCAGCHRESGKGGKITIEGKSLDPEDLTSEKAKKIPDERMYKYIYNGLEDDGMPAFKDDLTEAEIREVVRYVRAELQKMPETIEKKP